MRCKPHRVMYGTQLGQMGQSDKQPCCRIPPHFAPQHWYLFNPVRNASVSLKQERAEAAKKWKQLLEKLAKAAGHQQSSRTGTELGSKLKEEGQRWKEAEVLLFLQDIS